jgi:hypothetical protein
MEYRYTFLSQDETRSLEELASGENFIAETASDGGIATGKWSASCQQRVKIKVLEGYSLEAMLLVSQ